MAEPIDWHNLAIQLGTLSPNSESGGSDYAIRAIQLLLGEDQLRAAVDYCVQGQPGSELARSVLWHLHPWSAMQRCYEIYRSAESLGDRAYAVNLLNVVADRRALPWISGFLDDPDPDIQAWGVGVLDQLLWSGLIEIEECADLLEKARQHPHPEVRKSAAFIDGYLKMRQSSKET